MRQLKSFWGQTDKNIYLHLCTNKRCYQQYSKTIQIHSHIFSIETPCYSHANLAPLSSFFLNQDHALVLLRTPDTAAASILVPSQCRLYPCQVESCPPLTQLILVSLQTLGMSFCCTHLTLQSLLELLRPCNTTLLSSWPHSSAFVDVWPKLWLHSFYPISNPGVVEHASVILWPYLPRPQKVLMTSWCPECTVLAHTSLLTSSWCHQACCTHA